MQRVIIYSVIAAVFIIIINLLKYDTNFKGLAYDSSILDVVTYVMCCFVGIPYVGIHPTSKIAKILVIFLSLIKYMLFFDVLINRNVDRLNDEIFQGVKKIINNESLNVTDL